MDEVEDMMECLAIDDESSLYDYDYVDYKYEFDACRFFDFSMDETSVKVREAERWFRFAREYPPSPFMPKINLTNVLTSTTPAAKVHTTSSFKLEAVENDSPSVVTSSFKLEAVENDSPSVVTPSDCGIPSSEEKTKDEERLNYTRFMLADIQSFKAKLKSANRLSKPSKPFVKPSKPSKTFMKPTASHLAKYINAEEISSDSCGRSPKLQTPTRSEIEDIKRQKLEIGFLRKVSQLKHQTSFSHKTTAKTTIPQTPKLMTEERARWRCFRSQGKSEENMYTFKALPINRKILESPSFPKHKKNITHLPVLQKFQFEYDN